MNKNILVQKFFEENSKVEHNIDSFNNLIDVVLQNIVDENKEIVPTIIPHNVDDFKIKLEKIWVLKPEITEADGSKRKIFPIEARLRNITYAAPTFIEVSAHINGVQRESFTTQIGSIPIMLKSKYCHLCGKSRDELIEAGEDPDDPGGYFIINGTEKIVISIEDLASNKLLVTGEKTGPSNFIGRIFSEAGSYKIPHTIERLKDGIFYLSFTSLKRVPFIVILKALGMTKDEDIMKLVCRDEYYDEMYINLYEHVDIKTETDAYDYIAKKAGFTQSKDQRVERVTDMMDRFLLPNSGITDKDRLTKAYNLCKMLNKFIRVSSGRSSVDDKDHYMNKRLKLSGDLIADLIRVNLKVLINDLLYNFQRIVKRGKFPSIKVIIRDKLLTQRIYSSMATGNWVGGRKGISQRIQRLNFLETVSHLQRVLSPLSTTQENFEARELHPTHIGRLCATETPEGTNIGLRKNLALFSNISLDVNEKDVVKSLKNLGLNQIGK